MIRLFLVLLLNLSFVFAEDLTFLGMDEGSTLIEATGYASSPDDAKKSALQELVHKIKSKVTSDFESNERVTNDVVNRDTKNKIQIQGKSFFEGLHYGDPVLKGEFYEAKVIVTEMCLQKTITNLFKEISQPLETMNKKQKNLSLEKIEVIKALFPYKTDEVDLSGVSMAKVKDIEYLINRSLNMGQIVFKTNATDAIIEIKDETYKPNTIFFLEPGNYNYTIKSEGFHDEKGVFYAQAGFSKTVEKNLIEVSDTQLKVFINTDGKYTIKQDVASVLSNYDVGLSRDAMTTNALDYRFTEELITTIGDTKFYKFSLSVDAYKGNELYLTKKATLKRVASTKLTSKAPALAKALTKAILKAIELDKFKASSSVDYQVVLAK